MFTLQYAKNPIYNDAEGNQILLTVKWEEFSEEMLFTATNYDTEEYGLQLYAQAKAGDFGPVAPYVTPPLPTPTAESNKNTAISKLQATDWAATVDISNPQYSNPYLVNQDAFLAYRSQVREYAVNPVAGFIAWAVEPTAVWATV